MFFFLKGTQKKKEEKKKMLSSLCKRQIQEESQTKQQAKGTNRTFAKVEKYRNEKLMATLKAKVEK